MTQNVLEYLHVLSRKGRKIFIKFNYSFLFYCKYYTRYNYIFYSSTSVFKLFDTLFVIAADRCVYHGSTDDVLEFFSSLGFPCEEHNNPADFIFDVLQGMRLPLSIDNQNEIQFNKENNRIELYLNEQYMKTDIYKSIQSQVSETRYLSNENNRQNVRIIGKSRLNDLFYVSQRTLRNSFRNPALAILQTNISIFLGIIVGLIYLNIERTTDIGIKNRNGAIFLSLPTKFFQIFLHLD